jgi:hypothetical protein
MAELYFQGPRQPPIKNEASSVVENPRRGYAAEARELLTAAEKAVRDTGWQPPSGRIGLEMVIFKPDDPPSDPKRRRPDATTTLARLAACSKTSCRERVCGQVASITAG